MKGGSAMHLNGSGARLVGHLSAQCGMGAWVVALALTSGGAPAQVVLPKRALVRP
ncbi:hypothetical protein L484_017795 [Morus notabilis]|uniref:Uncharacterized protein n=1 Tax=Morus notabilis TaxID=981085 RepID=W9QXP2_9ROSA|nr:hypothetical protein L484_017795 [Morus notabilis]